MAQYGSPGMDHVQYQQSQTYYNAQTPTTQTHTNTSNLDNKALYVGNLDQKVNDALLWEVFSTAGHVESCKIIKNSYGESSGYGFVEFFTHMDAERALHTLNGKKIYDKEVKVNWATHSGKGDDTPTNAHAFNIFVGDLSSEINDETLRKAFEPFGTITDSRVMWDQSTNRSRGYGFVAFSQKADAERAMSEMTGVWLGNRAIRCNWANQKGTTPNTPSNPTNFEDIAGQTTSTNSTVYVGNLPPDLSESVLATTFQNYGTIEEIRVQKGKGYGFVKFQTHEQAARAIVAANETTVGGRPIRCSWGKERPASTTSQPAQNQVYGYYPQYGQNYMYNMQYYGQQYYQADPNYYAQGYDPYAAYAGYQYQQQQQPQHPPQE